MVRNRDMNNRRYLAGSGLLIVIAAVCFWAATVQGQSSTNLRPPSSSGGLQNGRYSLYQGSFEIAKDKNRTATGLFKIDTATGRVWRYEHEPAKDEATAKAKWVDVDQF